MDFFIFYYEYKVLECKTNISYAICIGMDLEILGVVRLEVPKKEKHIGMEWKSHFCGFNGWLF